MFKAWRTPVDIVHVALLLKEFLHRRRKRLVSNSMKRMLAASQIQQACRLCIIARVQGPQKLRRGCCPCLLLHDCSKVLLAIGHLVSMLGFSHAVAFELGRRTLRTRLTTPIC